MESHVFAWSESVSIIVKARIVNLKHFQVDNYPVCYYTLR